MDYLVTMTTHVPEGTREAAIDEIRRREAVRAGELGADGHLLRLWRPPLQPGEWRTLGLFAAARRSQLEEVLASMPLRVWRTDEVTALSAHPNDPGSSAGPTGRDVEFLTTFTVVIPSDVDVASVDDTLAREARRASELAAEGHLARLWMLPGEGRVLGLWRARDDVEVDTILRSLPLREWMTTETVRLAPHPSDPATAHRE